MQYLHGIPIWGEHDEATVAQIARCAQDERVAAAALMADGHRGYSMPIGGVVAYRNAVSPSGIGYDISCLAAGTLVTTEYGYTLPIEQVADGATCWDGERVRPISPLIGAVSRGMRPTVGLKLANGRTITATPDHHVLTTAGWCQTVDLSAGDVVACAPYIGLPFAPQSGELSMAVESRYQAELAERGLYPLKIEHKLFPVVLGLLAYASGDGHLVSTGKYISFYTTSEIDAVDIVHDLARLGYRGLVYRRSRYANRKAEICIRVNSKALHALFAALGSPVGKKRWPEEPMPWLFSLVPWLRARFLSAFCSAEMMTPRLHKLRVPNLQLKQTGDDRNAIEFVARLFQSLGYAVSIAQSGAARENRQDYVLQLLGGEGTTARFLQEVGFCYAHEKRVGAAAVASVVWQRASIVGRRTTARSEALALQAAGQRTNEIVRLLADRYGVSRYFIIHSLMTRRGQPRLPGGTLIAPETSGEICWVPVEAVLTADDQPVYDLVTNDPAQSFFANSIVVHNCGLKAARTDIRAEDVRPEIKRIMDQVARTVVFGIGQTSGLAADHELFDDPTWRDVPEVGRLKQLAREQLGTVGSGNHFVDIFEDEAGWVWVACHFGSRGLGHRTASGFLNLAAGRAFDDKAPGEHMDQEATVIGLETELGQRYWQAMTLAGRYAYAGRDFVVQQVLDILGARATDEVHNHHNYGWIERHGGEELVVIRKGATPAWPGQRGIIGGSMGDISVIVEGVEGDEARTALHSTVHGAGRVMSRTQAAGKRRWVKRDGRRVLEQVKPGQISRAMMQEWLKREGVELRGGGTDESPHVYRRLPEVLQAHAGSIRVLHTLKPLGVAMAGETEFDPYKD